MARFCPLDQRLSPSEYARAADKMFMLSFASSSNTKTMTRNGQMICNKRPLPGRRTNILRSGFLPQRVLSVFIGSNEPAPPQSAPALGIGRPAQATAPHRASSSKHNSFRMEGGHSAWDVSQTLQCASGNPLLERFRAALRNTAAFAPQSVARRSRSELV